MSCVSAPDLTIVCCIEAGGLEQQTLRMVSSLRTFGGPLSNIPVIAVIGRRGAPLRRSTLTQLRDLGALIVKAPQADNPAPWFGYANKAAAVAVAQRVAKTGSVAWVDSDVLFAAPPKGLLLTGDEDFAARSEFLPPAIVPENPAHIAYWRNVLGLFRVDINDVPWVDRLDGRPMQKMYFNSGVFVWRRASTFATAYVAAFRMLYSARIGQRNGAFHFIDQVVLTPVILREKLRWRHLNANEHFMLFQGFIDGPDAAPTMTEAQLVHYSKSLDPPYRNRFLKRLAAELPEVHAWLMETGDFTGLGMQSLALKPLQLWRGLRWRLHGKSVHRCEDTGECLSQAPQPHMPAVNS